MTRLTPADVSCIGLSFLRKYDSEFRVKTGKSLTQFAEYLAKGHSLKFNEVKVAVVPITAGKGIIEGFSKAVCSTLSFLGCDAFVTSWSDVSGFFEAFQNKVDVIFAGDDSIFSAFNLNTKRVIENSYATGKAYAAALELMVKDLRNKEILVIGAGRVGISAIEYFLNKGAKVMFSECDPDRIEFIKKEYPEVIYESNLDCALPKIKYILLAAPSRDLLHEHHLTSESIISSPAIPLGLSESALKKISQNNLIHDPLQLGVIAMLSLALKN